MTDDNGVGTAWGQPSSSSGSSSSCACWATTLRTRPVTPSGRPGPRETANPCGPVGAWIAHLLFQSFGWASLLVVWALGIVTLLLLRRRPLPVNLKVGLGLGLTLTILACLVGTTELWLGAPLIERSPTVGSGGFVGSLGASFLFGQFGAVGSLLILAGSGPGRAGALPRVSDPLANPGAATTALLPQSRPPSRTRHAA